MLIEVTPVVREKAAQIYGRPEDVVPAYDDWTDEELRTVLWFQRFGKEWLEERLARLEELMRRP